MKEEILQGLQRLSSGGMLCIDKVQLEKQKGIILDVMKKVMEFVLKGKPVVGVSLPVRIFEPRSTIDRVCDKWSFAPVFLPMACDTEDPLERMKQVITFAVAGLYMGITQMKPFNPLLGETYQGYFPDGTEIYLEHTQHHPPVSHFQVFSKLYKFYGYYEYTGKFSGNSLLVGQVGPLTVEFFDGQKITFNMPIAKLGGVLMGDRDVIYEGNFKINTGTMTFIDNKNYLKAEVNIGQQEQKSFFGTKSVGKFDDLNGSIFSFNPVNCQKTEEHSVIKGNWLEKLEFDGNEYWNIDIDLPIRHLPVNFPLPSDSRYREDLIWLYRNNLKFAENWKYKVETQQRQDRKLREEATRKKK